MRLLLSHVRPSRSLARSRDPRVVRDGAEDAAVDAQLLEDEHVGVEGDAEKALLRRRQPLLRLNANRSSLYR